jgi:hypothetical protein
MSTGAAAVTLGSQPARHPHGSLVGRTAVKVSVRTRGGLIGVDRQVQIDDARVTLIEGGRRQEGRLDKSRADRLADLAGRVAQLPPKSVGPAPEAVDAGHTEIEIADADLKYHIELPAGVDAPEEIWDLLDAVDAACEPPPAMEDAPDTSR